MIRVVVSCAVLAASLTACSNATDADIAACEDRGGEVVYDKFVYDSDGGIFNSAIDSGDLEYCKLESGAIGAVYNEVVTQVETGFWGDDEANVRVFNRCNKRQGTTYVTEYYANDTVYYYWLCVQDGRVLELI